MPVVRLQLVRCSGSTTAAAVLYDQSLVLHDGMSVEFEVSDEFIAPCFLQRSFDGGSTWETVRDFPHGIRSFRYFPDLAAPPVIDDFEVIWEWDDC